MNSTSLNWNSSYYDESQGREYSNNNTNNVVNNTDQEHLLRSGSNNYTNDLDRRQNGDSRKYVDDSVDHVGSTNYIASNYDTNVARPIYSDEWQATEEKMASPSSRKEVQRSGDISKIADDSSLRGI